MYLIPGVQGIFIAVFVQINFSNVMMLVITEAL